MAAGVGKGGTGRGGPNVVASPTGVGLVSAHSCARLGTGGEVGYTADELLVPIGTELLVLILSNPGRVASICEALGLPPSIMVFSIDWDADGESGI
jgi:hypothetical protein